LVYRRTEELDSGVKAAPPTVSRTSADLAHIDRERGHPQVARAGPDLQREGWAVEL